MRLTESVASLLRPVRQFEDADDAAEPPPAVLVGPLGEPLALLLRDPRTGEVYRAPVSLRVHPSADVDETLQRALTRPPAQRFDPVVCTDPTGAVLGLLRIEDLSTARRPRYGPDPDRPPGRLGAPAPPRQGVRMKTFACGDVIPGAAPGSPPPTRTASSPRSPATRRPTTASPTSPPSWCRRSAKRIRRRRRSRWVRIRAQRSASGGRVVEQLPLVVGEHQVLHRQQVGQLLHRARRWRSARPPSAWSASQRSATAGTGHAVRVGHLGQRVQHPVALAPPTYSAAPSARGESTRSPARYLPVRKPLASP